MLTLVRCGQLLAALLEKDHEGTVALLTKVKPFALLSAFMKGCFTSKIAFTLKKLKGFDHS